MYHKDGGSGVKLIGEPSSLKIMQPEVSHDDRYIWYANRTNSWQYNAGLPQYQISTYDRETGETKRETSRFGSAFTPTLSPDEVRSAMQTSSVDIGSSGYDTQTGWGRINAFNAVSMYSAQPDAQVDVNNFEIEASSNQMVFETINLSNGIDGEDDLEFSILESSYKWYWYYFTYRIREGANFKGNTY